MKVFAVAMFAFWLGSAFGHWDAKHGAKAGYDAGVKVRLAIRGFLK